MGDGSRVSKNDSRMEAIGSIDELNSHIGLLLAIPEVPTIVHDILQQVQHHLFDVGGELCLPNWVKLSAQHTDELDVAIAKLNDQLPPLKEFILPGGNLITAQCHVARAVCRRAERCVVSVHQHHPVNLHTLAYLNRLSDYLFVAARHIAQTLGNTEINWQHQRNKKN